MDKVALTILDKENRTTHRLYADRWDYRDYVNSVRSHMGRCLSATGTAWSDTQAVQTTIIGLSPWTEVLWQSLLAVCYCKADRYGNIDIDGNVDRFF
jgi:hypothetical protein